MERHIILLPHIVEEIQKIYSAKDKVTQHFLAYLKEDFCPLNRGLLYREEEDKLKIWSEHIMLICTGAAEKNSLKAIKVREVQPYQYHFILERGKILDGEWGFITTNEARSFEKNINSIVADQMTFIQDELKEKHEDNFSIAEGIEYKKYVEYWENHDIVKKYEEESLLEKKIASISEYKKFTLDFDKNLIKIRLKDKKGFYKIDDRISIVALNQWKRNYELNNQHVRRLRGIDVGSVYSYDSNNQLLIIQSFPDVLKKLMDDKELEKGFLWCDDKGTKSKLRRENEALKKLFRGETANPRLRDFVPEISQAQTHSSNEIYDQFLSDNFREFKDSQKEAVLGALSCDDIYLVQGPPGTGKTTVISEIIQYLVNDNQKVLLSSQTNLAVDNVLQRIGEKENVRAIRIGSEEKFELDNIKYGLEQRVEDLQGKMVQELNGREAYYRDLQLQLDKDAQLVDVHRYMLEEIKFIHNTQLNYKQYEGELKQLEQELQITESERENLQNEYTQYMSMNKLNMDVVKKMRAIQRKSKCSFEENIISSSLIEHVFFNSQEEYDIENYAVIIAEIQKLAGKMNACKEQQVELKGEMQALIQNIEKWQERITNLYAQEDEIAPSLKEFLYNDIKKLERELEDLQMEFHDLKYEIKELNNVQIESKEKALALRETALEIKEKIDCYIQQNSSYWMDFFNTPLITKEQFLIVYENLKTFRNEFRSVIQHVSILSELESYDSLQEKHETIGNLTIQMESLKEQVKKKARYVSKFVEAFKDYKQNENVKMYLKMYELSFEELILAIETERTNMFISNYEEKQEELKLYHETKDLQEEWASKLKFYQEGFEEIYIKTSNLICATCLGIASTSNNHFLDTEFDYVVIDEAARASSMELLIPMTRGKKIVLVGDHKQISPTLEKDVLDKLEREQNINVDEINSIYKKSIFGLMYGDAPNKVKTFLNKQFRMNGDISKVVSKFYYENKLQDGENIVYKSHSLERIIPQALYWIDTPNKEIFMEKEKNKSFYNSGEINIILSVLDWLEANLSIKKSVGIISPYKAQMNMVIKCLEGRHYEKMDIEINTVDAFQGREKEIIITSLVRNNESNKIGHIAQDSRMNVALSRAQELLFVIGNRSFIERNESKIRTVNKIIKHLDRRGAVLQADYFIEKDEHVWM
ncbi:AAA domain-containing protein [Bacillus luti]|uniref:AAA domain-containing protein n=1 Tax=Bacillus luti TaxID=2026191 RepID=UPI0037764977